MHANYMLLVTLFDKCSRLSWASDIKCAHSRGGEWYPENSGSRKFLFQSRNLGGVLNESRNLVFLCFFASRILEFLAARSRSLGVFLANGFDLCHDKIVYFIKTYDSSLLSM